MIDEKQVVPYLLEACPSFRSRLEAMKTTEPRQGAPSPLYDVLAEFARHLVRLKQSGSEQEFPRTFEAVERLIGEGDAQVSEAVSIGLLEDIHEFAGKAGVDADAFVAHLGKETKDYWAVLGEFWEDSAGEEPAEEPAHAPKSKAAKAKAKTEAGGKPRSKSKPKKSR